MKIFLTIIGACVTTLGLFGTGFLTAIIFLTADPVPVWKPTRDTAGLWTPEPTVVSKAGDGLQRLPTPSVDDDPPQQTASDAPSGRVFENEALMARSLVLSDEGEFDVEAEPTIDTVTTASVDRYDQRNAPGLSAAHVRWCSSRYRSYRTEDNSYVAYSGALWECVSPYVDDVIASSENARAPGVQMAGDFAGYLSPQHIQSCFARYRSYRPDDNSYQPYGGGPRRQCE